MKQTTLWDKKTSIKEKLTAISKRTTAVALLLVGIILIVQELFSFHFSLMDRLQVQARIIGANAASALMFTDQQAAEDTLKALAAAPHITRAVIYRPDGVPFAEYVRSPRERTVTVPAFRLRGRDIGFTRARLYTPIIFDGEVMGAVCIESDLQDLYSRLLLYTMIVALVILLSGGLAFLLLERWQRAVTQPILDLAALMHGVSAQQNYTLRARHPGSDELDSLADSFNDMLSQIERRDEELLQHRQHLEELVERRTAELAATNATLQQELVERRRAEEDLKKYQQRMEALVNSSQDMITLKDAEFRYLVANRASQMFLGKTLDDIIGRTDFDVLPREAAKALRMMERKALTGGKPVEREVTFGEGEYHIVMQRVVNEEGQAMGVAAVTRNVTEYKRLQDQLRQSQKMEAVGHLAGGIAHDFNNILTAIIGYATLMRMKMRKDDPLLQEIDQILSSSKRAAQLTQGLLAFSRKQIIKPAPSSITQIVEHVSHMLTRLIGEDIEFKTNLTDDELTCLVDPIQIEQVLMNLATNARDAMHNAGTFTIRTERVFLTPDYGQTHAALKAGPHALISVSDSGEGMDEETQERIFEPFFTTKELGRGTGLGLSIVYGIVSQHNGSINVYSEPGSGTTFKIYLPLVEDSAAALPEPMTPSVIVGGMETILLAEDQAEVRELMQNVLERFGYRVILAEDGEEAVRRFAEHRDEIDLALLDVIMPKMNGKEACEEIRHMRPDVKVLFASGYTADILHKRGFVEESINFIAKPILPRDLLAKLREILDANHVNASEEEAGLPAQA